MIDRSFAYPFIILLISEAPLVQVIPPVVEFTTGQSTVVSCTSVAYPAPTYSWLSGGEVIESNDRIYTNREGQLTLRDLRRDDQGEYTCVATNVAGTGRAVAALHFIGKWMKCIRCIDSFH